MCLSPKVSPSDQCSVVAEFSRDHGARLSIERALGLVQRIRGWATGERRLLTGVPIEREPLVVDWDRADHERVTVFPQRRRREPVPA